MSVLWRAHSLPDESLCEADQLSKTQTSLSIESVETPANPLKCQGSLGDGDGPPASRRLTDGVSPLSSPVFSSPATVCRICHEDDSSERLVAPCRCSGSVGLVHISCIEKWLSAANKDHCEICTYRYVTERRPKPLQQWLLSGDSAEDSRNLLGDGVCFILLTSLALIGGYLCVMGVSHYLTYNTRWEAAGLMVLGILISLVYISWFYVTCRYHFDVWRRWRRNNQQVRLLQLTRLPCPSLPNVNNNVIRYITAPPDVNNNVTAPSDVNNNATPQDINSNATRHITISPAVTFGGTTPL